jgi:hypothetical protein
LKIHKTYFNVNISKENVAAAGSLGRESVSVLPYLMQYLEIYQRDLLGGILILNELAG